MSRFHSRFLQAVLGLIPLFAFAAPAAAQCAHPDGLDGGPCCSPTQVSLPAFPAFKLNMLDVCWDQCNIDQIGKVRAEWSSPYNGGLTSCGPRRVRVRMRDSAGVLLWRGWMTMQYSRTWNETTASGTDRQVWRFLVNGDLRALAAAGGPPCPVPPCAPPHQGFVKQSGYVDYALDCATGGWEFAAMLTHACDDIDHFPGLPRGGVFHPGRSYSFIGPAASFVVGAVQPTEGGASGLEAMRRVTTGFATCEFEEQCQHFLSPLQQFCECGPATATPQFLLGNLGVFGSCGSVVQTTGGPFLPGFLSMGLGAWTDPNAYPGLEVLRWNAGGYQYVDACVGTVRDEVFFGVTTLGGDPARQILSSGLGQPLPPIFIDQSNSIRAGATVLNIPYVSDHVLNLNH